ncbi:hypothetical protein BGX31_002410 [Mortierella sp. GBA43]|nr:hypothetical protein BGX31_002410 [Mortierella sp. GBA43]
MSVNPCPASTSGDGATTTYIAEDKYTIITTLRKRRTVDSPHPKPKRRKTESLMNDVKEHALDRIDKILERSINKRISTIHCDGKAPIQKSDERSRRSAYLRKELDKSTKKIDELPEKKSAPATIYNKCRHLYRAPSVSMDEILEGLSILGWKVCRCELQSDTHIAEICWDSDTDVNIITKDSDMIVYEHVQSITMLIGRSHELTTFKKEDVLSSLSLPTPRHLLLTGILTTNDYSTAIPWYGIKRNAELVKGMVLQDMVLRALLRP